MITAVRIGYDGGMKDISFERRVFSLALIAIGATAMAFAFWGTLPEPKNNVVYVVLALSAFSLVVSAGAALGAGIFNLWKRPLLGAIVGTTFWFAVIIIHWLCTPPE
jgi:hypothetical protein